MLLPQKEYGGFVDNDLVHDITYLFLIKCFIQFTLKIISEFKSTWSKELHRMFLLK